MKDAHITFETAPGKVATRITKMRPSAVRLLFAAASREDVISLAGGMPDVSLLPKSAVRKAAKVALEKQSVTLQYGGTNGAPETAQVFCDIVRDIGIRHRPENVILTTGAQEALDLIAKTFCDPGDIVITEGPTYLGALQAFSAYEPDIRTIPFDDEGTPSSCTKIIDHGVYTGYMHTLETASQLGVAPTGNGRAENFGKRHWVRMTNTYFGPGEWDKDELIAETKDGILTDKMVSGMEDPVGGCFEAKALRGYLVKNGEVQGLVKSFTLTGKSVDILCTVDALSDQVILDGGMCGKGIEDWVRVSSGGPYMRARMIVGGGQ